MKRRLLTIRQAATYLGLSAEELALYDVGGTGPAYVEITTRVIRYLPNDLDEWVSSNRQCDDCHAVPGEPCHHACSSHWT